LTIRYRRVAAAGTRKLLHSRGLLDNAPMP
jgi:hypothetical protein